MIETVITVGAAVSALATLAGGISSAFAKRTVGIKLAGIEVDFQATADVARDARLYEAREALQRQESIARWNGRAAASLTFGQYIIGGILASSFVQQSLSPQIVGVLGVLVLLSSLIHQRYRPDLQASGAKQRGYRLRTLIRAVEDDLFLMKNDSANAPSIHEIRKKVSTGLAEIEESELVDVESQSAESQPHNKRLEKDARKARPAQPRKPPATPG